LFHDKYKTPNGGFAIGGHLFTVDDCMCAGKAGASLDFAVLTLASEVPVIGHARKIDDLLDETTIEAYLGIDWRRKPDARRAIEAVLRARIQNSGPAAFSAVVVGFGLTHPRGEIDGRRRWREIDIVDDFHCNGPSEKYLRTFIMSFWCQANKAQS